MNNLCYQFSYDFETNYCFPEIVCLFTLSIKLPQGGASPDPLRQKPENLLDAKWKSFERKWTKFSQK